MRLAAVVISISCPNDFGAHFEESHPDGCQSKKRNLRNGFNSY